MIGFTVEFRTFFRSTIFIVLLLANFTACSVFDGLLAKRSDQSSINSQQRSLQFKGDLSNCLSEYGIILHDYFNGRSNEQTIRNLFGCFYESLEDFSQHARGNEQGKFSKSELKSFFEKYFFKNETISDSLLHSLLRLKVAVVGGVDGEITHSEIQKIQELLSILQAHFIGLLDSMPFRTDHLNSFSRERLQKTFDQLGSLGEELAVFFVKNQQPYSMDDFENLSRELEKALAKKNLPKGSKEKKELGPELIYQNIESLRSFKEIFISYPRSKILGTDWSRLFRVATQGAETYFTFSWLKYNRSNWFYEEAREEIVSLILRGVDIFSDGVLKWSGSFIPFENLDRLIDSLEKEGNLPSDMMGISVQEFLCPFFKRFLEGDFTFVESEVFRISARYGGSEKRRMSLGSRTRVCHPIQFEFKNTTYVVDQGWRKSDGIRFNGLQSFKYLVESWNREERNLEKEFSAYERRDPYHAIMNPQSWNMPDSGLWNFPYLFQPDKNIATYDAGFNRSRQSFQNLSFFNLISVAWKVIINGYAYDVNRKINRVGLKLDEYQEMYGEIKKMGRDLGIFDWRNPQEGENRFREANLFTSNGNGDDLISFEEGVELYSMLLSAKILSHEIHTDAVENCRDQLIVGRGPYNRELVQADCYRKSYFEGVREPDGYWRGLPRLRMSYVDIRSPYEREEFKRSLETAARFEGYQDLLKGKINSADTDGFILIPHYVESLFSRFDLDASGTIGQIEVSGDPLLGTSGAFPVFKETLAKISGVDHEGFLRALLTYILKEGEVPRSPRQLTQFGVWWRKGPTKWEFEADRIRVVNVFAELRGAFDGGLADGFIKIFQRRP